LRNRPGQRATGSHCAGSEQNAHCAGSANKPFSLSVSTRRVITDHDPGHFFAENGDENILSARPKAGSFRRSATETVSRRGTLC
ncbi:MAG: hypothetical protein ACRDUT_04110, partial [Mycobacterium sp.]